MRVKILVKGPYTKFDKSKRRAEVLEVGDVRDWPDRQYAISCIEAKLVEQTSDTPPVVIDGSTVETIVELEPQEGVERYKDIATSGAIKLADKVGIELDLVTGTGRDGKIVVEDVRKAMIDPEE